METETGAEIADVHICIQCLEWKSIHPNPLVFTVVAALSPQTMRSGLHPSLCITFLCIGINGAE